MLTVTYQNTNTQWEECMLFSCINSDLYKNTLYLIRVNLVKCYCMLSFYFIGVLITIGIFIDAFWLVCALAIVVLIWFIIFYSNEKEKLVKMSKEEIKSLVSEMKALYSEETKLTITDKDITINRLGFVTVVNLDALIICKKFNDYYYMTFKNNIEIIIPINCFESNENIKWFEEIINTGDSGYDEDNL